MDQILFDENGLNNWFVYIVACSDGSLYTGISTDPKRRFNEHLAGRGAKYFYARKPIEIVYLENTSNRSLASKREAAIKKLRLAQKQKLIQSCENQINQWQEYFKLD